MPKYPGLFLADAHQTVGSKQIDAEFALDQVEQIAAEYGVEWVIACGDTIDKQRNRSRPIANTYRFITRLHERGIEFAFNEGQHDADEPPWFSGIESAVHLHRRSLDLCGINVYGLNYLPRGRLQQELDKIPKKTDLLVAHQVWADWMGDIALPQGSFADIPIVKAVVTGDFHQKLLQRNIRGKDGQKMTVVSPGALYQKAINEPPEHFVFLLNDKLEFESVKLRSRVFIDWERMITEEDVEQFVKRFDREWRKAMDEASARKLPAPLSKPMLRVTYAARLPDALRRIKNAVADRAIVFTKELPPETKESKAVKKAGKAETVTPLTVLPDEVDPDKEPEVFNLVSGMLEAADPQLALEAWRRELLGEG